MEQYSKFMLKLFEVDRKEEIRQLSRNLDLFFSEYVGMESQRLHAQLGPCADLYYEVK